MSRSPRPLGDAVARLRSSLAPATLLAQVQEAWPAAAGPEIARHSEPVAERGGTVVVRCDSAVWASELSLMAGSLLDRLNDARGGARAVTGLQFTTAGSPG